MGQNAKSDENSSRIRRAVIKLALICVGFSVGLAACEIGLRLAGISYPVFEKYDPDRGIALKPNVSGWYRNEGEAFIETNRFGYRDIEHKLEKPKGTFRVAILGDSFAEARQVDIQDTFWKLTETKLQSNAKPDSSVEVLNFGVGSYGTTEALVTFEKDVVQFSPDLVILAFYCGNDIINNSKVLSRKIRGEEFRPFLVRKNDELVLDNSFSELSAKYFKRRAILAAGQFRTFQLINNHLKNRKQARIEKKKPSHSSESQSDKSPHDPWFMGPNDDDWREAWSITEELILRLRNAVETSGAEFALVTMTMVGQVNPDKEGREKRAQSLGIEDLFYNERRLAAHGKENAYHVITLAQPFQEYVDKTAAYLHGFENTTLGLGHWNEEGHKQAANVIVDQLINSDLLNEVIEQPPVETL